MTLCSSPSSRRLWRRERWYRSSPGGSGSQCTFKTACRGSSQPGSAANPTGAHKHRVEAGSRADGIALGDLPIGDDAWITLLVRDGEPCNPIQISSCGPTTGC
jgi:hypothetical protein